MTRFASADPATRAVVGGILSVTLTALAMILAALIALGGLGRLSSAIDFTRVPGWFWYYRHDPDVARWMLIGASVSGLVSIVGATALLLSRRRSLHGDARWASRSEERRAGLRARAGILLGHGRNGFLISDGPEHVMVYAPTRSGKGVGVVIPNLLAWPGSTIVLDIKRENYAATAGYRRSCGQEVVLFDPLDRDGRTARYNPLAHIDRGNPILVIDELQRMAWMLFPVHAQSDPFWAEAARTGFIGVGSYVAATPELPFTMGEIYRQLTHGDPRTRMPEQVEARRRQGRPLPTACEAALADFCASSENTFASVRQSITTRMGLWLNPLADAATSASDFDLRTIRGGRVSIYLGASPDNMARVAPLYSLLFQQLVDLNSRSLPSKDDQPVLLLLDEFARLGPAPLLAHAFSWVAGYGLRLLPVIQSPSQLRALYGPDTTEEILTNCGIELVFAPKELRIAQELSDRLGYYTYEGRSLSRPRGLGAGRRSVTVSDQRRALMLPQELIQMTDRNLIVLKAGVPPVRGRKIVFYRERTFLRRRRAAPETGVVRIPPRAEPDPTTRADDELSRIIQAFADEGIPPPQRGASEQAIAEWVDRALPGVNRMERADER